MSDYRVSPDALDKGAAQIDSVAGRCRSSASSLQAPETMMAGVFGAPFVETIGRSAHEQVVRLLEGLAHEHGVIADGVRQTASKYRQAEDFAEAEANRVCGG